MVPPSQNLNLDIEAISGIFGSISIACWVVVFSPQIVENFRRGSADGLSLQFIIVWLAGDVFNILGAVLQGVLPTMIILAVYYTLADIVLLCQCFYYRGFTFRDEVIPPPKPTSSGGNGGGVSNSLGEPNETTGLLRANESRERRRSSTWSNVDATHLSPATPLLDAAQSALPPPRPTTALQATLFNIFAVLIVCLAGVLGWWISNRRIPGSSGGHSVLLRFASSSPKESHDELQLSLWGQIFGYLCAVLYLGSRIPQILLNYRRKSTDGVSVLFFLFACIGNLTYVLSIFAFEGTCSGKIVHGKPKCAPGEAANLYGRYMLVNASWLAGSLGTLLLDMGIFAQFFMYRPRDEELDEEDDDDVAVGAGGGTLARPYDDRPLLQRGESTF